jgi:hypothetical protein
MTPGTWVDREGQYDNIGLLAFQDHIITKCDSKACEWQVTIRPGQPPQFEFVLSWNGTYCDCQLFLSGKWPPIAKKNKSGQFPDRVWLLRTSNRNPRDFAGCYYLCRRAIPSLTPRLTNQFTNTWVHHPDDCCPHHILYSLGDVAARAFLSIEE